MNSIQMLALDLDDTLLRSDLTISYRTRNAIKRAEAAGVTVVLASGRAPAAMEQFSRFLGMNKRPGYLICKNGTIIQESHTGNVVYETMLDTEPALTFRDMVGKGCYKLIIPGDPMLLKPLESLIRTYLGKDITLFTSQPYYLEIMPRETDKGTALAKIAEITGISAGETLAIGDSMNDEAMIRWAGIGVAMANGDERIKNIAGFVTEHTNDEDGVADVIDKYFFGKGTPDE